MRPLHAPSPYLVPFDGSFRVAESATGPPTGTDGKKALKARLKESVADKRDLVERFYADDRFSLLLVFQAMDAAGKDGTIRSVMTGVNPAAVQVFSFKKPSAEELDHDFLWRTARCLPERGRVGIFNRSYYEEVLVVRVHPEFLGGQKLPNPPPLEELWAQRFQAIREHERHLANAGTVILKFWLHVSSGEQQRRLLSRIDDPRKNWKFNKTDIAERRHWDAYMGAYEDALNETSRPWAPWYAIPADNKAYMRLQVSDVIRETLERMDPRFPVMGDEQREELARFRAILLEG